MSSSKPPRDEGQDRTKRDAEDRGHEMRLPEWTPPSMFPEPHPQAGIVYHWVRVMARGEPDAVNYDRRRREGWEPCPAIDYPELASALDSERRLSDTVQISGLLLCRMSVESADARRRFYAEKTRNQIRSVHRSMFQLQDRRMSWLEREGGSWTEIGGKRVATPKED
ncbi:MAG: hypothetical protein ABW318_15190 [Vicinamibacterales bacterium]